MFRKNYKQLVKLLVEVFSHQWADGSDHSLGLGLLVADLQRKSYQARGIGRHAQKAAARIARTLGAVTDHPHGVREVVLARNRDPWSSGAMFGEHVEVDTTVQARIQANIFARRLLAAFGVEAAVYEAARRLPTSSDDFETYGHMRRWRLWITSGFWISTEGK